MLNLSNFEECDTFSSYVTKESFKINHHFDWNTKCLIYLMPCEVYGKHYVGSATESFRFWWNNYKNNQHKAGRDEDHTQKYFHEYFLSYNQCLVNDIEIILFLL